LVKTQSSSENGLDELMAWQLFAVLSSIEGLDDSSIDEQEEVSHSAFVFSIQCFSFL